MVEDRLMKLLGEVVTSDQGADLVSRILLRSPTDEIESLLHGLCMTTNIPKSFWLEKMRELGQRPSAKK